MIEGRITPAAGQRPATLAIAALFERHTGQILGHQRLWRVESALKPLLRELPFDSLDALASAATLGEDRMLVQRVVDALLNHETSFFRDAGVIETVAEAAVALHAANPGRRLRIWSAGCSTGQEPLSLAILLDELGLGEGAADIVATDVSMDAIARARAGAFSQFEIQRGLPVRRMMTWFDGEGSDWVARRELVRRIQFRQHNLVFEAPPPGLFDIVLCRNVLLYFAPEVRGQVLDRLAGALRPDGCLVLGAGETVIGQTDRFVVCKDWRGLYRRADTRR